MKENDDLRALKKPPTGTKDLIGDKYSQKEYILNNFKKYMELRGFEGVETSILEHLELYTDNVGPTSDIVSKELFGVRSLNDKSQDFCSVLRAEGTLSTIRCLFNTGRIDEKDLRLYYCGPMFRYSRPQKGRFRQFTQLCCEMVNTDRFEYDVEAIYLAWSWLKKFTGSELRINTLGRSDARKRYREELYKFLLVNKQRLKPENQLRLDINVMRVLDQLSPEEELIGEMPDIYDFLDEEDKTYFDNTLALLKELSIDFIRDPSLVRGLDYYEQTVFEFIVQGQAIAGGGRYLFDRRRFGESALGIPGVGWGIGLDRLPLDNLSTQELEVHIIHINNYSYANEIISIINQSGGICIPIYGDFSSCFKIASKKNAKSIISYSEIDRNERCINYKTKSGSKRIKIQELADCVRG